MWCFVIFMCKFCVLFCWVSEATWNRKRVQTDRNFWPTSSAESRQFFKIMKLVGDIRLKGHSGGVVTRGTLPSRLAARDHAICIYCWTWKQTKYPTEEIWVRGPTAKWDSGEGLVNHMMILTCCSSVTEKAKHWWGISSCRMAGLVERLEGIVEK